MSEEANPSASAPDRVQGIGTDRVDRLVTVAEAALELWSTERRQERIWRFARRLGIALIVGISAVIYLSWYARVFGFTLPTPELRQRVAIVHVEGPIGPGARGVDAGRVVRELDMACRHDRTRAVVVRIRSPGGNPSESARIADRVRACSERHHKTVVAYIDGIGASGGYLIAIQAEEIVADRYAYVGSIGAVRVAFDVHELLEPWQLREYVYATGDLKYPAPVTAPPTPQAHAYFQSLVDTVGQQFLAEVSDRRGSHLRRPAQELYTGQIWLAHEALDLGLIDTVSGLDDFLDARWPGVPVRHYRPAEPGFNLSRLISLVGEETGRGVIDALQQPAAGHDVRLGAPVR